MSGPGGQGHGSRGASVGHLLAEGRRYLGLGRLLFAEQSFRAALAVDSTCTAAAEGLALVEEARDNGEIDVDDEFGDDATVVDPRIFLEQGERAVQPAPPGALGAPPSVVVAAMTPSSQRDDPTLPVSQPPPADGRTPPPRISAPSDGQAPSSLGAAPPPLTRPPRAIGIAESFPPGTFLSPSPGPRQIQIALPALVGLGVGAGLLGVFIGYLLFG